MQTIELTIDKNRKPRQILEILKQKEFRRGDMLKVKSKQDDESFAVSLIFCLNDNCLVFR